MRFISFIVSFYVFSLFELYVASIHDSVNVMCVVGISKKRGTMKKSFLSKVQKTTNGDNVKIVLHNKIRPHSCMCLVQMMIPTMNHIAMEVIIVISDNVML